MESLILCVCLTVVTVCLAAVCLGGVLVWRGLRTEQAASEPAELDNDGETPEEQARRLYEQGFVNLMNYDGSPRWKEREML